MTGPEDPQYNEQEEQLYEDDDPTMQGLLNEDWDGS
jgi:hypothetical protein